MSEDVFSSPRLKCWTKREYNLLVEKGAFTGQRLFLFRGSIVEVPQMGTDHARSLAKLNIWLHDTFQADDRISIRCPFETPGESMPEPDAAVLSPRNLLDWPHPRMAKLIIEVADTTLDLDREKALEYAAAGVPEYWLVDVVSRTIEIYRQPDVDASTSLGFRYSDRRIAKESENITPVGRPTAIISMTTLLTTTK